MLSTVAYLRTLLSLVFSSHYLWHRTRPHKITLASLSGTGLMWCGSWSLVISSSLIVVELHRVMDLKLLLGTRTLVTACLVSSSGWNGFSLNARFNVIRMGLSQVNRNTGMSIWQRLTNSLLLHCYENLIIVYILRYHLHQKMLFFISNTNTQPHLRYCY